MMIMKIGRPGDNMKIGKIEMKRKRLNKLAIENLQVADRAVIFDIRDKKRKENCSVYEMVGISPPFFAIQVYRGDNSTILHNQDGIQLYMLYSDARRAIRRINKTIPITSI